MKNYLWLLLLISCSIAACNTEDPSVASKKFSEQEVRQTKEYWTEQRMRDAKPMPMPSPTNKKQ